MPIQHYVPAHGPKVTPEVSRARLAEITDLYCTLLQDNRGCGARYMYFDNSVSLPEFIARETGAPWPPVAVRSTKSLARERKKLRKAAAKSESLEMTADPITTPKYGDAGAAGAFWSDDDSVASDFVDEFGFPIKEMSTADATNLVKSMLNIVPLVKHVPDCWDQDASTGDLEVLDHPNTFKSPAAEEKFETAAKAVEAALGVPRTTGKERLKDEGEHVDVRLVQKTPSWVPNKPKPNVPLAIQRKNDGLFDLRHAIITTDPLNLGVSSSARPFSEILKDIGPLHGGNSTPSKTMGQILRNQLMNTLPTMAGFRKAEYNQPNPIDLAMDPITVVTPTRKWVKVNADGGDPKLPTLGGMVQPSTPTPKLSTPTTLIQPSLPIQSSFVAPATSIVQPFMGKATPAPPIPTPMIPTVPAAHRPVPVATVTPVAPPFGGKFTPASTPPAPVSMTPATPVVPTAPPFGGKFTPAPPVPRVTAYDAAIDEYNKEYEAWVVSNAGPTGEADGAADLIAEVGRTRDFLQRQNVQTVREVSAKMTKGIKVDEMSDSVFSRPHNHITLARSRNLMDTDLRFSGAASLLKTRDRGARGRLALFELGAGSNGIKKMAKLLFIDQFQGLFFHCTLPMVCTQDLNRVECLNDVAYQLLNNVQVTKRVEANKVNYCHHVVGECDCAKYYDVTVAFSVHAAYYFTRADYAKLTSEHSRVAIGIHVPQEFDRPVPPTTDEFRWQQVGDTGSPEITGLKTAAHYVWKKFITGCDNVLFEPQTTQGTTYHHPDPRNFLEAGGFHEGPASWLGEQLCSTEAKSTRAIAVAAATVGLAAAGIYTGLRDFKPKRIVASVAALASAAGFVAAARLAHKTSSMVDPPPATQFSVIVVPGRSYVTQGEEIAQTYTVMKTQPTKLEPRTTCTPPIDRTALAEVRASLVIAAGGRKPELAGMAAYALLSRKGLSSTVAAATVHAAEREVEQAKNSLSNRRLWESGGHRTRQPQCASASTLRCLQAGALFCALAMGVLVYKKGRRSLMFKELESLRTAKRCATAVLTASKTAIEALTSRVCTEDQSWLGQLSPIAERWPHVPLTY